MDIAPTAPWPPPPFFFFSAPSVTIGPSDMTVCARSRKKARRAQNRRQKRAQERARKDAARARETLFSFPPLSPHLRVSQLGPLCMRLFSSFLSLWFSLVPLLFTLPATESHTQPTLVEPETPFTQGAEPPALRR